MRRRSAESLLKGSGPRSKRQAPVGFGLERARFLVPATGDSRSQGGCIVLLKFHFVLSMEWMCHQECLFATIATIRGVCGRNIFSLARRQTMCRICSPKGATPNQGLSVGLIVNAGTEW